MWQKAVALYEAADSVMALCGADAASERENLKTLRAGALYRVGDYGGSRRLYEERLEWCRSVYGESSDNVTDALLNLANIKAFAGDVKGGSDDYSEVERRLSSRISQRLRFLPSDTRESYLSEMLEITRSMQAFALKSGHECDEFTERSWDALLLSKGLLLASERSAAEIVRKSGTDADRALLGRVIALERSLSAVEARPSSERGAADDILRGLVDADSRLAAQCASYGSVGDFLKRDSGVIREALGVNDVVVDMTDFVAADGRHKYCAYIVRRGLPHPMFVSLCDSEALDSLSADGPVGVWRHLSAPSAVSLAERLASLIGPAGSGTVFFVPSGAFHLLPVESFVLSDGRVFGDVFNVVRLSSARDVPCFVDEAQGHMRPSAALFGGLDYTPAAANGSSLADIAALPGSMREIAKISKCLGRKCRCEEYAGTDGTAAAFRHFDGNSPTIIHIATHGIWSATDGEKTLSSLSDNRKAMEHSALMMAGGELLTASEIASLDLSGTSLVSLS